MEKSATLNLRVNPTLKSDAETILTLDSFPDRFALFEMKPGHSWEMRRMVVIQIWG